MGDWGGLGRYHDGPPEPPTYQPGHALVKVRFYEDDFPADVVGCSGQLHS